MECATGTPSRESLPSEGADDHAQHVENGPRRDRRASRVISSEPLGNQSVGFGFQYRSDIRVRLERMPQAEVDAFWDGAGCRLETHLRATATAVDCAAGLAPGQHAPQFRSIFSLAGRSGPKPAKNPLNGPTLCLLESRQQYGGQGPQW